MTCCDVRAGPERRFGVGQLHASGSHRSACDVFPDVETANFGLNFSVAQLVTWNGTEIVEVAPSVLCRLPVTAIGLQFVGLNVNPGRSIVTLTCWICNGMPVAGSSGSCTARSSVVIVSAAVAGSTSIFARTTTQSHAVFFSRSNGPAFAGFTIDSPNGAP